MIRRVLPFLFLAVCPALVRADDTPLLTVAEKSEYKATSRHADVLQFCESLAKQSSIVRLGELGTSGEGRKLPLVILADPPVATPEEAAKSKKLVVFAMGNIHAGEVDGKEALLMLARDLATAKERPLLKDLVLVFAPNFNADGNEKIDKTHRLTQAGPEQGVGVRTNAQGLDLNRDYVKLESPEVRALVRFFNQWDPAVFVDCHTTDGSFHRYTMTYEGGRCPAGDARIIDFTTDEMLPAISGRLEKETGYKSYYYGNFSPDRTRWETVPATPRYGGHYFGLRNRISILSESYTYAPFKDRVLGSLGFVKDICAYTAENKDRIRKLLEDARAATVRAGTELKETTTVPLQFREAPRGRPYEFLGFVEEVQDGKRVNTGKPKSYELTYWGGTETTLAVRLPYAYLIPASYGKVVEDLQRHGVVLDELREDIELDVEAYKVEEIKKETSFQKHDPVSAKVTPRKESRRIEAGAVVVRTAQPLGSLAAFLLEPQSCDGLVTWNFFDEGLRVGKDFPVLRLPARAALTTGRVRPLPEDQPKKKSITFDTWYGNTPPPNFTGNPVSVLDWLDDGEHFLQVKEGKVHKVDAVTGRSQPFYDPDKLAAGLATLPTIDKEAALRLVGGSPRAAGRGRAGGFGAPSLQMNPQRTAALFVHENDLYHCNLDGTRPVRLTRSPGPKEIATFSPDGKFVAFIRDNNLCVVDVATQTEKALTTDGSATVFNGKADWVYFEEIYLRSRHAFWWSPDSTRLAFLRFDDGPVKKLTVVDHLPVNQRVEETPYPKAGQPNPQVRLGVVSAGGGTVAWADLDNYTPAASLITRAGWTPDSSKVFFYVQDRAQTWLDFCTLDRQGGELKRLFRETTRAWVDDPGDPTFLKDGSFLLLSERSGWKHVYHFDKDGKLQKQVTDGNWEVSTLHRLDEDAGWVYVSGTRDSSTASNLYRARLDGSGMERLTNSGADHRVSVAPRAKLFLDTTSDVRTPPRVRVCRADGSVARVVDTNPVHILDDYRLGTYERARVKTPDGFELEASLLKPANFDPAKKYPVWFMTYAGPHAPTVRDGWGVQRFHDEMLANMGFLVFRCDPRSASGKGACSSWTAYRQLGVQELKDIETAIRWLSSSSYVDAGRIGMSGHSYGGFMTAYALTHSKLFAAGIAGAPVTDWRNYDSIYTERYMNTPQENPAGYDAASVVKAAKDLHGRLLIVHGVMDDNVHVQNSLQLIQALEQADRDFEMMVYPQSRHGIAGKHYQRLQVDFMKRVLKPEPGEATKAE
jgi:dipeptidyl aminopeptidase/acylaminoacyl peptidase